MKRPGDWYVVKLGDAYLTGAAGTSERQREAERFEVRAGAEYVIKRRASLAGGARVVLVRRRQAARGADFTTAIANSQPRTA